MSTVEIIAEKANTLGKDYQQELLRYVDYLIHRQNESQSSREWSRFSAFQLNEQYAPGDAIYDAES